MVKKGDGTRSKHLFNHITDYKYGIKTKGTTTWTINTPRGFIAHTWMDTSFEKHCFETLQGSYTSPLNYLCITKQWSHILLTIQPTSGWQYAFICKIQNAYTMLWPSTAEPKYSLWKSITFFWAQRTRYSIYRYFVYGWFYLLEQWTMLVGT